jgi:pimeloyl-ACP methyl ester carboxylesterase
MSEIVIHTLISRSVRLPARWLTLAAILLAIPAAAKAQPRVNGRWEGTMRRGSSSLPIAVDLPTGTPSRGFFTAGDLGAMDVPLRNVRLGSAVHWELVGDQTTMVFTGRVAADSIVGMITEGSSEGMFSLRRVSASTDKPYRSTPIRFNNGGVELAGTVLSPRTSGRHPAVVFIHGSGAEGRWASGFLADYVARRGVVALIYDKRGVGESTGDWKTSTLEDLSRDAKVAAHLLAGRPDVDSRRVGLYGHSQGGYIAPMVAAGNPDVRWIVDADGNIGPQYEQDLFRVESALAKRFDGQQLRDAMSLYREFVDVARGGLSRDQLHADQAKYRSAEWYDALGLPDDQDWIWEWYRGVGNTDNRRAWAAIDVPVLLVYGERDEVVPPRKSIDAITGLLAANHDTAVTVRLLGGADHALRVPPADPLGWPRYADGFPTLIVDWIHGLRQ